MEEPPDQTPINMFNLLKSGLECNKMANKVGKLYVKENQLIENYRTGLADESDVIQEIHFLAYLYRKVFLDKIEKYNWPPTMNIIVPAISNDKITLGFVFQQTIVRLQNLAKEYGLKGDVDEIIDKGSLYQQLDMELPNDVKKQFD